jgi:uncharacterized protein (TIGR03083 family)
MTDLDRTPIEILRRSHERLVGLVGELDDAGIVGPSYDDEWTIAQVCSHLGSGAEIGLDWLAAAVGHREPMDHDEMSKVWDRWNAMSPREQVDEGLGMSGRHVAAFDALDDDSLAAAHIRLFGMLDVDGVGLAGFRISEHALHTWDIAVALDPSARVAPDAIATLVDGLSMAVSYLAKPEGRSFAVAVETSGPARTFTMRSRGDAVAVDDSEGADGTLRITAEAFIRLAYGRLDDDNADGAELASGSLALDDLRATFPGI